MRLSMGCLQVVFAHRTVICVGRCADCDWQIYVCHVWGLSAIEWRRWSRRCPSTEPWPVAARTSSRCVDVGLRMKDVMCCLRRWSTNRRSSTANSICSVCVLYRIYFAGEGVTIFVVLGPLGKLTASYVLLINQRPKIEIVSIVFLAQLAELFI